MALLLLLALSLLQTATAADAPGNACESLIPPALATKLNSELTAYQLPNGTDIGEQRSKELSSSGDWPCPLVVLGDFDGNGSLDRALLLKGRQAGARLIGALNDHGQWQISLNEDWPLALGDSELQPQESGFYQREEAIRLPAEQFDQLPGLQAENAAFTAGKVNGQNSLYALVNGKWQKLLLHDQ